MNDAWQGYAGSTPEWARPDLNWNHGMPNPLSESPTDALLSMVASAARLARETGEVESLLALLSTLDSGGGLNP